MKVTKHLALLLALGSMTAFAGAQMAKTQKMKGMIGDSKCAGKNHDAACVKKCINMGAKPVFVDSNNKVWSIDDPASVESYYGKDVTVVASINANDNSIHIQKVKNSSKM